MLADRTAERAQVVQLQRAFDEIKVWVILADDPRTRTATASFSYRDCGRLARTLETAVDLGVDTAELPGVPH